MKKLPPVHPPSFGSDDFQEPRALKKKNEATSMESVKKPVHIALSKIKIVLSDPIVDACPLIEEPKKEPSKPAAAAKKRKISDSSDEYVSDSDEEFTLKPKKKQPKSSQKSQEPKMKPTQSKQENKDKSSPFKPPKTPAPPKPQTQASLETPQMSTITPKNIVDTPLDYLFTAPNTTIKLPIAKSPVSSQTSERPLPSFDDVYSCQKAKPPLLPVTSNTPCPRMTKQPPLVRPKTLLKPTLTKVYTPSSQEPTSSQHKPLSQPTNLSQTSSSSQPKLPTALPKLSVSGIPRIGLSRRNKIPSLLKKPP